MTTADPSANLAYVPDKLIGGVRDLNMSRLLELLWGLQEATRSELQARSGLSKATVAAIVTDLLDAGLVRAVGKRQGGVGRSSALLEVAPMARSVIGVQVGDDQCDAVLTDLRGRPYTQVSRPLHATDPDGVIEVLIDCIGDVVANATSPVMGVGLGVPGYVDTSGRISVAISHGWRDVPIADRVAEATGLPSAAANRAKVSALGLAAQRSRDNHDFIYIFLGSGIAAGIVSDGRLCVGRNGAAGDIGHLTVDPDGALCGCGNRGCLHTVAAQDAVLSLARANAREDNSSLLYEASGGQLSLLSVPMIAVAAERGDRAASATLDTVATTLGIVIANLLNTLNPHSVVLGGPLAELGDELLQRIRAEVQRRALGETYAGLELSLTSTDLGAVGAAGFWLSRHVTDSSLTLLLEPAPRVSVLAPTLHR
ncbi:ROK family transcriptional regulator [Kribbella sp. NPDC050459]|uniref:ROK family transcriptional regulator n=1 Tax=Kribbella sp. NPDC050459 TaxID=3155785 RepID=UPI0034113DB3